MAFTAQTFMDYQVPDATQTVSAKDAILYALSVGYGAQPLDPAHLRYIYERDLIAAPTLANIAAHAGPWMKVLGLEWTRVVHAEQRLTLHRPLPLGVALVSRTRALSVVDRGERKGAFAAFERTLWSADGDSPVATIVQTNGCLADGGCGSAGESPPPLPAPPERAPDLVVDMAIAQDAAALYRLNGDLNPLHIDPEVAQRGGFARPLLHGLCTFGHAGYAVSKACAAEGLAELTAIAARFSAPMFPGEPLSVQIWREGADVRFRAIASARDKTVLDCGVATLGSLS